MARRLPVALGAVGILLVIAAALVKWVAAPALVKISLDKPNVTVAEGKGTYIGQSLDLVATRTVVENEKAESGDVVVFDETLCISQKTAKVDEHGCDPKATSNGLPLKSTDRHPIDNTSAESVNDAKFGPAVDGKPMQHQGVGYTYPLGTKKQTYQMFDTVAGKAAPAQFKGTSTIEGLTVYQFTQDIEKAPVTLALGAGTYTSIRSVWVEPTTGVIVKGQQDVTYALPDGTPLLKTVLTFTPDTVKSQADLAKDGKNKIALIRWWIPLVLLVLGVALLVGAWFAGRRKPNASAERREPVSV